MARRPAPSPIAAARTAAAVAQVAAHAGVPRPVGAPAGSTAAFYKRLLQTVEPWERQNDESDLAWALFCSWRDLPPDQRTFSRVARENTREGRRGRDPKAISLVADRHRWVERAREWDRHLDRQAQAETIQARRAMARKMATTADLALDLIQHELQRHLDAAMAGGEVASLRDLATLVERFVPVGLRARDLPETLAPAIGYGPVRTDDDEDGGAVAATSGGISVGTLMTDPDFREALLHAQARASALREGPPAAIDVVQVSIAAAEAQANGPAADWDDDDGDLDDDPDAGYDDSDDADMDPLVSMDTEPV